MSRRATIVPYRDGPYLIRGPVVLRDQDGELIECQRSTVALCRCGKSRTRPFCDGTHQVIRFTAPSPREDRRESPDRHRPSALEPSRETTRDGLLSVRRLLLQAQHHLEALPVRDPGFDDLRRQLIADIGGVADRLENGR